MFRKAFLVLATLVLLSGCGNGDDALPPPNTEVPIDVTITDPDFGLTIRATSLVRNVDPKVPNSEIPLKRSELVAVKLEVTTGTEYDDSWNDLSMSLISQVDGEEKFEGILGGAPTTEVMNAAGRTPLTEVGSGGATGTGWIMAYVTPKGTDSITLRYHRPKTQIFRGGSFPEQDFDAPLITPPAGQ